MISLKCFLALLLFSLSCTGEDEISSAHVIKEVKFSADVIKQVIDHITYSQESKKIVKDLWNAYNHELDELRSENKKLNSENYRLLEERKIINLGSEDKLEKLEAKNAECIELQQKNIELNNELEVEVKKNKDLDLDMAVLRNKTSELGGIDKKLREMELKYNIEKKENEKNKNSFFGKASKVGVVTVCLVGTFVILRIYWTLYPGEPAKVEPEEAEKQGIHMVNVEDENGNITQREETMSELWERCKAEARDYVEEHIAREDEAARVRAEQAEEDAKLPYEEAKARQEQRIKEQRAREREEARIAAEERAKRKAERAARVIKEPSKKKNSARKSKKKPSKKEKISKEV